MVLSASDNLAPFWRGVRSPQALMVGLGGVCAVFFGLAREAYPIVAYGFALLVGVQVLVVVVRYAIRGPEADRLQPTLTIVHSGAQQMVQMQNVDPAEMEALIKHAVKFRKPLPPPAGIVRGSAADPAAIVEISAAEAETLRREDLGEDAQQIPQTRKGQTPLLP